MAYGGIRPGNAGLEALKTRWDSRFLLSGYEEAEIVQDFMKPQGVDIVGERLNLRIIPAVTIRTAAATDELDPASLTFETASILEATDTPTTKYVVVALPKNLTDRLGKTDTAALEAGYRELMLGGLNAAVDVDGGELASGISTVKGPANADQALILDMQTSLATNSKNHVRVGQTPMHLKFHPSQIKYIHAIAAYANAEQRGDSANPNVKGVILKAQGMTLTETGNIQFTGGAYWNMLFASTFACLGYNQAPTVDDGVPYGGLTTIISGRADFLTVEVFDADAVAWKSA